MQRLASVPKSDLESTMETMQNKTVMEQLEKGGRDIEKGRTRNIDKFIKELKRNT